MFAQIQSFSITNWDELAVSPSQFDEFINDANSISHPIGALYTSTVRILRHAFWLAEQKATLAKKEYKELLRKLGWQGEEKRYLKLNAAFNVFSPHELAQVEPRTLFQIAENFKKYGSVVSQMKTLAQITQDAVRSFMKQCQKPKAKKEEEAPTIWRMAPEGTRVCQIGPIYNQSVGVKLQTMMDAEGLTAQAIVEEALLARFESKYESTGVVETVETVAPEYEEVEMAPTYEQSEVTVYETTSWDKDEDCQDSWSFEPEEKDDEFVDIQSEVLAPSGFTSSTVSISTSLASAPVDLLIHRLQTASSWQEISEALKTHEDCKQEAWDALTPTERKRIIELTPPTIKRLNQAKREGLIMDWRESRPGVYQVKCNGCLFWEIVFEYRIEEFFAQLYSQERAQV